MQKRRGDKGDRRNKQKLHLLLQDLVVHSEILLILLQSNNNTFHRKRWQDVCVCVFVCVQVFLCYTWLNTNFLHDNQLRILFHGGEGVVRKFDFCV